MSPWRCPYYHAEQRGGDDALRCGDCKTGVEVSRVERKDKFEEYMVLATRFLGQGQSADDNSWLEQLALKRNEMQAEGSLDAKKGPEIMLHDVEETKGRRRWNGDWH